jgi:hypothetical protein
MKEGGMEGRKLIDLIVHYKIMIIKIHNNIKIKL